MFCWMQAAAKDQNIHALRSAYLFYFSSLIEWPARASFFGNELHLCVLTENEEDRYQLETIDGKYTGEHTLRIEVFEAGAGMSFTLESCHMVYLNSDFPLQTEPQLQDDVLAVTEGEAAERGDIHLFRDNNKLKFEIDIQSLKRKGFKASSRLLRLSREERR